MFTKQHFIWIGICTVFITLLSVLSIKKKFSFKTSAVIMAIISLLSETAKLFTHMEPLDNNDPSMGMTVDPQSLPLHLCSLFIFAFFYLPFAKNEKVKSFITSLTVPVSIIGGGLAILMATSGTDFLKPYAYQCFLYHSGMIWFSVYLIATKQADLGMRAWLRNMAVLLCMSIAMIWVNGALKQYETNFFYVVRPPVDGLPILNLDNGWYAYFVTILLLGIIGISAVHLPSVIKDIIRKKTK